MAINAIQRRLKGIPYNVVSVLDLVGRAPGYSDRELNQFMWRYSWRGADYLRLFPDWSNPFKLHPWKKLIPVGNTWYIFNIWDDRYFESLARVCDTAYRWKMGIYFDLFDHCFTKGDNQDENPWFHMESVNGIYDLNAIRYYEKWIEKVWSVVGKRGSYTAKSGVKKKVRPNLYSLGNELNFPSQSQNHYHQYGREWVRPLANKLRDLGYTGKICFSADSSDPRPSSNLIRAYVSNEGDECCPDGHHYTKKTTVEQAHGQFSTTAVLPTIWNNRILALSDDGTNEKDEKHKAVCVGKKYCSADLATVVECAREAKESYGKRQIHHIDILPRSVSEIDQKLDDLDLARDASVFQAIDKKVYGVNPTRKFSKWYKNSYIRDADDIPPGVFPR